MIRRRDVALLITNRAVERYKKDVGDIVYKN